MLQRPGTPPEAGHLRPVMVAAPDRLSDVDRPAAFAVRAAGHAAVVQLDAVPAADRGRPLVERLRQPTLTPPALRECQWVTPAECG